MKFSQGLLPIWESNSGLHGDNMAYLTTILMRTLDACMSLFSYKLIITFAQTKFGEQATENLLLHISEPGSVRYSKIPQIDVLEYIWEYQHTPYMYPSWQQPLFIYNKSFTLSFK